MRRLYLALLLGASASAQSTAATLESLQPPSTPAFVLLGIEPASVQRPDSPRAISTTLLSSVRAAGGFPKDFATEITPYWLRSRPTFTFDDFYQTSPARRDVLHTAALTIARSFALSLATTPRVMHAPNADTAGTSVGVGARMLLWPGRPSPLLQSLRRRAPSVFGRCAALEVAEIEACYKPFADSVRENLEPVGLVMQLAFGVSGAFPGDTIERGHVARAGVWLTPSYRVSQQIELIAVGRWLHDDVSARDSASAELFDGGARLRWRPTPLLALSGEALGRAGRGGTVRAQHASRFGGLAEFRASESWYVFYGFGKDFEAANVKRSALLSTIGLNVGFGPKPMVNVR